MINKEFWNGKRVFITGHTGFKGSWLSLWLSSLGANVTGYALEPPTHPSLFDLCDIRQSVSSIIADVRNGDALKKAMRDFQPEIVIHMAAQPLVRDSYKNPVETYSINVMGTVNLLEAIRLTGNVRAVVNVTTDKCYENKEWNWGYRENDSLGGYDPYSNSKACSELVTASYRSSFFNPSSYSVHRVGLATARAGNVIGGGDFASERLIPDCIRALLAGEKIRIRNPHAIRPWQHVLEPLSGYLVLVEKLYDRGPEFSEAWNFGPCDDDAKPVEWIAKKICVKWGCYAVYEIDGGEHPHEANFLKLDCSKAKTGLGWFPRWDLETALDKVIEWALAYQKGEDLRRVCLNQIEEFSSIQSEYSD